MKKILLLCCLLVSQICRADTLKPVETKIENYLAHQKDQQVLFLEKLVNINSGTTNIEGVHQVGEILRLQFERLGFTTRWLEEPAGMKRAATLVAARKGNTGKKVLLIGHLDTVFPSESPFQKFELHGNTATGPGVIDDKGGDTVILYALKALEFAHALDDTTITVVLTGDEEDSGKPTSISRKPLFAAAKNSDVALDFEWSITADTATTARRGIVNWQLNTQGKEAHSADIFQNDAGDGAIFAAARILDTMRAQLSREKYLSFNPGLILGGTAIKFDKNNSKGTASGKENVIAKSAIVTGDLRYLTEDQKQKAEKNISAIVKENLPATSAEIIFQDGIPAMQPTQANSALLQKYSAVSENLGYGPIHALDPGMRGAGDISHVASIVPANLAGLGALGTNAHSVDETLNVNSLEIQTKRAAIFIYRLTHP